MNRTEQLAEKLKEFAFAHKDEIEALSTTDERGGEDAALIPGWRTTHYGAITTACKLAGVPTMMWKYESVKGMFPVNAFPDCIFTEAQDAYYEVFHPRRKDPKEDNIIEYDPDWDRKGRR